MIRFLRTTTLLQHTRLPGRPRKSHRLALPSKTTTARTQLSRSFREVFASFLEMFVGSQTCLDLFRPVQTLPDAFGHDSDAFGRFQNFRKTFALMPNTGEVNDEMCAPRALIISEMSARRFENNNNFARQQL